ncbi:hypothetical protein [Fictibacillus sp. KU28468]|uniref:hypothetical protein n=1 Tax=Fictibacillus sp. KU28468 TaxID=2991053 RepID=UPI00223D855F|nr:hypothetical protein [Fictibacillus sp. KU28468]UZJ79372.1 hypothetical protein OKX00_02475 [Fictibacillus sp. KU28468]
MRKSVNLLLGFLSLGFAALFVYKAVVTHEGILPVLLRILAALVWLGVGILSFVESNISSENHVRKWFNQQRVKGKVHYSVVYGIISWGLIVGYVTWIFPADFQDKHLFKSALTHIALFMLVGIYVGWQGWRRNVKDAQKMGLF